MGEVALQALGIISYDDAVRVYRMGAYNDGRYMETDLTLADDGGGSNGGSGWEK